MNEIKDEEQESEFKSAVWYLNGIWHDGYTRTLYLAALLRKNGIDPDAVIQEDMDR